jgi:hypothetical protein
MAEKQDKPKTSDKPPAETPDTSPGEATAPGPITPEHESGTWEQTIEDRKKKGLNPDGTPKS